MFQLEGQRISDPVYSLSGHILFTRQLSNAGIWALPFSLVRLEARENVSRCTRRRGRKGLCQWNAGFRLYPVIAKQKRFDEAIAAAKRGEELDPQALSLAVNVAERLVEARRHDDAIAQLKKILPMDPNFANTHFDLGLAYYGKGMYRESVASFQRYNELNEDPESFHAVSKSSFRAQPSQHSHRL